MPNFFGDRRPVFKFAFSVESPHANPPLISRTVTVAASPESASITEQQFFIAPAPESSSNWAEQEESRQVCERLLELSNDYLEDFQHPMIQASVQAALTFFQRHPRVTLASFSAEPSGRVLGTWRKGREVLTMRFVDQEQIHFTLALEDAETKALSAPGVLRDRRSSG